MQMDINRFDNLRGKKILYLDDGGVIIGEAGLEGY